MRSGMTVRATLQGKVGATLSAQTYNLLYVRFISIYTELVGKYIIQHIVLQVRSNVWKLFNFLATFLVKKVLVPDDDGGNVSAEVLYEPEEMTPRADIIFIHGLHGSRQKTWRQGDKRPHIEPKPFRTSERHKQNKQSSEDNDESYSCCWPQDWLPLDCPGVRVIALNYSTDPFLWRPFGMMNRKRTNMLERSCEMIEHLKKIGVGNQPIVWVGHSKGGLFIKQIMVYAWESGKTSIADLYLKTQGILFYSVPHKGSFCANISLPFLTQSVELTEVRLNCENVLELHSKFLSMVEDSILEAEIISITETVQTLMNIIYIQIVAVESADADIGEFFGVDVDHRSICKPINRQCFLYQELANLINRNILIIAS